MREIILDTETTGLDFNDGDRVIEICACEMVNYVLTGKNLHLYILMFFILINKKSKQSNI